MAGWRESVQPTVKFVLSALVFLALAPAGRHAHAEDKLGDIEIRSVFVEIDESDRNFTVVDARVDETATAGVFFGVIGAGINSAANASQDDKKADTLRSTAESIPLADILSSAIEETLSSNGSIAKSDAPDGASHTLRINIHNWGLMRRSRESREMRVFLNLSVDILDSDKKGVWRKKRENNVGQNADLLENITPEILEAEIGALAEKSGKYIAYQMIYR